MHSLHEPVRGRGEDRECPCHLSACPLVAFPQAGEGERRAIGPRDCIRPLGLALGPSSFVERRHRDDRAPLRERASEARQLRCGLRPRVDRPLCFCRVLGSARQQSPFQRVEMALSRVGMPPDHQRLLARRGVPVRAEVRQQVPGRKQPRDQLRRQRARKPAAHGSATVQMLVPLRERVERKTAESEKTPQPGNRRLPLLKGSEDHEDRHDQEAQPQAAPTFQLLSARQPLSFLPPDIPAPNRRKFSCNSAFQGLNPVDPSRPVSFRLSH